MKKLHNVEKTNALARCYITKQTPTNIFSLISSNCISHRKMIRLVNINHSPCVIVTWQVNVLQRTKFPKRPTDIFWPAT